jgi:hypothetical protein
VSTEAVLYLPSSRDAATALDAVAGRPLGFRMLMAAVRAGCSRVWVPAQFRGGPIEQAIAATPSARAASVWLQPDATPPAGPLLLLSATTLTSPAALRPLLAARPPAVLGGSWEDGAPVVVVGGDRVPKLWSRLTTDGPIGDTLTEALSTGDITVVPSAGWCVRAAGPMDALERPLYGDLGSPVDTRLDTVVHRRLSRPITRLAVAARLSPNVVTVASLLVGLLAAAAFWQATPAWALLGLLLYAAAVVLDHADGEVARLTFAESRFGARLDVVVDTLVHVAIMLALGVAAGGLGVLGGARHAHPDVAAGRRRGLGRGAERAEQPGRLLRDAAGVHRGPGAPAGRAAGPDAGGGGRHARVLDRTARLRAHRSLRSGLVSRAPSPGGVNCPGSRGRCRARATGRCSGRREIPPTCRAAGCCPGRRRRARHHGRSDPWQTRPAL